MFDPLTERKLVLKRRPRRHFLAILHFSYSIKFVWAVVTLDKSSDTPTGSAIPLEKKRKSKDKEVEKKKEGERSSSK